MEDAVLNIVENPSVNQELSDACGESLGCLVDGVCGGITDAVDTLENQQVIVEEQVEVLANIFPIEQVSITDVIVVTDVASSTESQPPTSSDKTHGETDNSGKFWYPAWANGSTESACLNDSNAPDSMVATGKLMF